MNTHTYIHTYKCRCMYKTPWSQRGLCLCCIMGLRGLPSPGFRPTLLLLRCTKIKEAEAFEARPVLHMYWTLVPHSHGIHAHGGGCRGLPLAIPSVLGAQSLQSTCGGQPPHLDSHNPNPSVQIDHIKGTGSVVQSLSCIGAMSSCQK